MRSRGPLVLLLLAGLLAPAACSAPPAPEPVVATPAPTPEPTAEPGLRVLFVGNSYTFSHDLPKILEQIAGATEGGPEITTRMIAEPGWTLQQHWDDRRALAEIRGGSWTHVVLQGHSLSTVQAREDLLEYGRRFDSAIDEAGAQTVLFQTWARRDHPEMLDVVRDGYGALASATDAVVVPVGEAWAKSWSTNRDLHLWHADGSHPSPAGSYLAAAVFYRTLTGEGCVGADHAGLGQLDVAEIRFLQELASGEEEDGDPGDGDQGPADGPP